jgi:hypothetical protein
LRAGISGRAKNTIDLGRLRQFPDQGVLATSAADDQNFHRGERASAGNEKQVRRKFPEGLCGSAASAHQLDLRQPALVGRDSVEPRQTFASIEISAHATPAFPRV